MCAGSLCVRRNGLLNKTRCFTVASGLGPDHNLGVYNNSVDTIERAFTERYFLCLDGEGFRPAFKVGPSAFTTPEFSEFSRLVSDAMPALPVLSSQQVVDSYRGPKQRVYQAAYESLMQDAVTETDSLLSAFVKFEKQDVCKAPRVINPRSARYNLRLGKYLKHAEHHFFKAINKAFGGRTQATVIKGYNADQSAEILRQKWELFWDPVAIGLDASKFDMHVSVRALRYEHAFYAALFPRNKELRKLLRWQLRNRGTARAVDGTVKFEMSGTRCSGDLNTSLGNCLLMCAMVWCYAREMGIDVELANNGDDCVVFLERKHATAFRAWIPQWFRKRGFAMTVEDTVEEFEQVEFCQTKPVELQSGWRMVRNLSAVLNKDPMCLLPVPNGKVYRKWLDAVGTCGGTLSKGVPVHGEFYKVFKRNGQDCGRLINEVYRNRSQLQLAQGVRDSTIDARSRVSYYYAFGILPDEQVAAETHFTNYKLDHEFGTPVPRDLLILNPGFNIATVQ
uniref:RNA-directed RNA polymerase n=1 Tax=Riboviria sp. TaxID=2585031 RepID=A0A893A7H7_9VIRU|nr:MAG: hypothetical protein 1 [Riboviria sp.]